MKINNYVWENDLSLNDLVLKQKEKIDELQTQLQQKENIIKKYEKHIKNINEWLDYNTERGDLYWYNPTPFPELELSNKKSEVN